MDRCNLPISEFRDKTSHGADLSRLAEALLAWQANGLGNSVDTRHLQPVVNFDVLFPSWNSNDLREYRQVQPAPHTQTSTSTEHPIAYVTGQNQMSVSESTMSVAVPIP